MLAHQGGWDEILLVAGPIVVIVLMLWRATRAAERNQRANDASADVADEPATGAG